MAFPILTGINDPVTSWSWRASTRAYSTDQYFHKEEEDETVIYAFKPSFSKKDWFAPENMSSFGEIKMNRDHFPCMRSFSKDLDATVNEAFLKNLEVLFSTSFSDSVKTVVDSRRSQRIVFTGHSSGGASAILATVWYLETYFKKQSGVFPEPLCLTFGAPLVGDYVFKHALRREDWSRFFMNFVTRFDIVPRIMLAQKASTNQTLPYALSQLNHTVSIQENDQSTAGFYATVMTDVETAAHEASFGNDKIMFSEENSSHLELSPYRSAGTFVFSTGTRLVSMNNSDAILQILFYASQSTNEQELSQRPYQSIRDHRSYQEMLDSVAMESLHHLPLDGVYVLSDFGLTKHAKKCVHAAFEADKKRVDNQSKIDAKLPRIVAKLTWIEKDYKLRCRTLRKGYYDSFKESNEEEDFIANVIRAELAGSFDEVLVLLKKGQLPDGFEGRSVWINLATRYRRLMEPLDIANYHRFSKNEDTGSYMEKGRPNRYKHAQRLYEHDLLIKAGRTAEEIQASSYGSFFWTEYEELRGKQYEYDEERVKKLEELLEGCIRDKEVDDEHIFLEGSSFRKWWHSLPEHHKRYSPLQERMNYIRDS